MKLAMAVLLLFGGIAQGQVLKGRIDHFSVLSSAMATAHWHFWMPTERRRARSLSMRTRNRFNWKRAEPVRL
jgi:hypothetical protein